MAADRIMLGLHGAAGLLALAAALYAPRAGQAAVMIPLTPSDPAAALRWADREQAELLAIDSDRGRVIARIASHRAMLSALGAGLVPVAARAPECGR